MSFLVPVDRMGLVTGSSFCHFKMTVGYHNCFQCSLLNVDWCTKIMYIMLSSIIQLLYSCFVTQVDLHTLCQWIHLQVFISIFHWRPQSNKGFESIPEEANLSGSFPFACQYGITGSGNALSLASVFVSLCISHLHKFNVKWRFTSNLTCRGIYMYLYFVWWKVLKFLFSNICTPACDFRTENKYTW